jgi:hypothetical protein
MLHDDQTDILVSRVIDGRDTPADWHSLETIASSDPEVWRTLALAHRDHRALVGGMRQATEIADRVDMPGTRAIHTQMRSAARLRHASTWAGWAAAAMLAIAFVGRVVQPPTPDTNAPATASLDRTFTDAAAALQSYLAQGRQDGRVVTERPMRLLGMEQLPDGAGYRVLYERPIVESAVLGSPSIVRNASFQLQ